MRVLQAIVALGALLAGWWPATAQDYPTRPVKIVVPFAAGSSTDLLARVLAKDFRSGLDSPSSSRTRRAPRDRSLRKR